MLLYRVLARVVLDLDLCLLHLLPPGSFSLLSDCCVLAIHVERDRTVHHHGLVASYPGAAAAEDTRCRTPTISQTSVLARDVPSNRRLRIRHNI